MNVSSFKESLSGKEPPQNCSVYLNALWYDAKGEWITAHKLLGASNSQCVEIRDF